MQPNLPPVPEWVRCTVCVTAVASVPLLVIATCFGGGGSGWAAAAAAVAYVAVRSARLAFNIRDDFRMPGGKS